MLIQQFKEQVERTPEGMAIKAGNTVLTYRELDRYTDRIAHAICQTTSGQIAGLLLEHGLPMIVAILGALKAGKIYVPLSVDYPQERLSYMLTHSGASLIISNTANRRLAMELGRENNIPVLDIDGMIDEPEASVTLPERTVSPDQIAYILYTSGSTGRPKGVMQNHGNVLYYIRNWVRVFSITENDRLTLFSSFSHDGSVQDMFGALLAGATILPFDVKKQESVLEMVAFLSREQITLWHSVPTLFRVFCQTLDGKERFPHIRFVALGGEQVRKYEVELFEKCFPQATLAAVYGQTESSVDSIALIRAGAGQTFKRSIIGTPFDNTQIFVINEDGDPVQPLETGEILVACPHITPGYWKNPEAGEKAFADDDEFGRLYWTGDLGRLLVDGNIEFMGRRDFQVKIRGFRVELSEIESHLLSYSGITDAVVTMREDSMGDAYLCAYIVNEGQVDIATVTDYLSLRVPDYMVPSTFVELDRMPRTPNGKTDRKALPDPPTKSGTGRESAYTAPQGSLELKLAQIWGQVLGMDPSSIGAKDNFFRLGGHSLKATILVSKIHRELNIKVPLVEVFRTPTINDLATYISNAKEYQYIEIEPVEEMEYYALSSAQKRLYFLQQMDVTSTGYNMPMVLPLGKDVDIERFESTFKKLIARHDSLRTSFETVNGEPVQKIHESVEFNIEYIDLLKNTQETLPKVFSGVQGAVFSKKAPWSFIHPFDLSKAPLLRSAIIKDADGNHTWMIDIHHIVTDGTSNVILTRDFLALYDGQELPPLPLQYKDFSQWQNRMFQQEEIKTQEAYWMNVLSGEIPRLDLPADEKRPEVFTFAGDYHDFEINGEDAQTFKELSVRNGVTLFMNFLTLLNTLFYKYTGQEDILIGSGVAGRPHADLQGIIGMFVNTLVMRNYPSGDITYQDFLKEVGANSVQAMENQDVQFEDIVNKLKLERDTSRNPLFDILLMAQNFRESSDDNGKALSGSTDESETVLTEHHRHASAKFDMTFFIFENGDDLLVRIEYYTSIFKRETIQRLVSHLKNIVKTVIAAPSIPLRDIGTITDEEKNHILYDFNYITDITNASEGDSANQTVHSFFEEQVKRTPDHIAVVFSYRQITYRALDERADHVADRLRENGVGVDAVIGIMMERSIELIVGILGILKAGGAYLPLDVDYPKERIDYMLTDSGARLLLATGGVVEVEKLRSWEGKNVLLLDHLNLLTSQPLNFRPSPSPVRNHSNLVYVMYTSGSTGKPKGVMLEHRNLINLIHHQYQNTSIAFHRVLQFAAVSFDVSFQEIFSTLLAGGTLFLIDKDTRSHIEELMRMVGDYQIETLFFPSAFFKMISSEHRYTELIPRSVRHLVIAGEQLIVPARFGQFIESRHIRIHNHYGPTETHVVTTFTIEPDADKPQLPPIGKPISNTCIYITDTFGHLQPVNIPGELFIGGLQVGRGYLNNPELTNEKFTGCQLPVSGNLSHNQINFNPSQNKSFCGAFFKKRPAGGRLYRTGDLARWLDDGNIEFLGRMDHQVKVRGFRIELGEIENRLLNHPEIKEAVVIAREDRNNDKYLCAYFVSENQTIAAEIKGILAGELPDYMVPAYFIQLEKMPLTANGKIDRKSLPSPELKAGRDYVAPRDGIEIQLVELWADILSIGKEAIGIDSSFFELGGHSLKIINLLAKIQQRFGCSLSVADVYGAPTIRQLAQKMKHNVDGFPVVDDENIVLLRKGTDNENHLFLIHAGSGEVSGYIELCQLLKPEFTYWGIKSSPIQDFTPSDLTIEEIATRYISKIKKIQPQGPYHLGGWCIGGTIAFEMVRQLETGKEDVASLTLFNSPPPIVEHAADVSNVDFETEKKWLLDLFRDDMMGIKDKLNTLTEVHQLWPVIIDRLEANNIKPEIIRPLFPEDMVHAVPNFETASVRELVYYLNIIRSYVSARSAYVPSGKNKTRVSFIAADRSLVLTIKDKWNAFCENPMVCHLTSGDHYSIFKQPDVVQLADVFTRILMG
ncbi:MAG: amino acid adenylation domain-containing protein [Candidatus Omnitrophota bacterium]